MKIDYYVKVPSLELSWLPTSFLKSVNTPRVAFVSNVSYGGCYYKQQEFANDDIDLRRSALICISNKYEDTIASTIAHEFRHHWQQLAWGNNAKVTRLDWSQGYDKGIIKYFTSDFREFDALRFEHKYARDYLNDAWWGLLVNHFNSGIDKQKPSC